MPLRAALALLSLALPVFAATPPPRAQVEAAAADLVTRTKAALAETGIPGAAIAVVFEDEVIRAEGFGVREAGKDAAVDAETVFQLASVSKAVGSSVLAALVGKGVVTWDARLSDLDPGFAMFDPWVTREVTLRDLYCHRSGLPDHAGDLLEDLGYDRAEILHRLRFQPPDTSFRSAYAYTNFGLSAAAFAAAKRAGTDWETLSEELVYRPLGMTATSSRYADFVARPNRALGHQRIDGTWRHLAQRDPDAQSPAGGVSSNVADLARWVRLQLDAGKFAGRQVIPAEALAATHAPQILTGFSPLDGLPGFYGLGWNVSYDEAGRLRLNHSGAFDLGAATFVGLVPAARLGVIILTNASPIGVPEALGQGFFEQALTGKITHDWMGLYRAAFARMNAEGRTALPAQPPAPPSPAGAAATYVGDYVNAYFGPARVTAAGDQLTLALGPNPATFPLRHWDRDTFTFTPSGENANGVSAVTFTRGPDGRASHVWIEHLDANGLGTFPRAAKPE